jgi:hypothetical protein
VHAWVDQKLVKSNFFMSFIHCPKVAIESLFYLKVILNVNQSLKQLNAILTPRTKYSVKCLICHTPIVSWGHLFYFVPVFNVWTMKIINKNQCRYVPFMLSDIILAQWWHPVASREALDLLHWAMCVVTYRRIAMAINMARKVGVFLIVLCLPVTLAAAGAIQSK